MYYIRMCSQVFRSTDVGNITGKDTRYPEDFIMVKSTPSQQPEMSAEFHLPRLKGHNLFEITVDEVQHLYSSGAFTSEEYTKFCLDRVQAVNPYLETVIETNPDALSIAQRLDEERNEGNIRGPLHGIPVLVKDVGSKFQSYPTESANVLCLHYYSRMQNPALHM